MKKRRLHIIVATTLFAALLWISVELGIVYQTSVSVPLVARGVPLGMALKTPVPHALQLRLRGEGWQLARLLIGNKLVCIMDLASLPTGQPAITVADVVERLNIPPGIQAVGMVPDTIGIAYDSLRFKRVPLLLDYTATFKERYGQVGVAQVIPDSVSIEGAQSILAGITFWKTAHVTFENLKAPVDLTVPVAESDRYQLSVTPPEARVQIGVQWYAEKVLAGMPVEVLSVPPHREVILVPPKIDLVVRGGVDQLSALQQGDVSISVDYSVILSDTTGVLVPEIKAPAGLQIVSKRPERLQYIVRKRL